MGKYLSLVRWVPVAQLLIQPWIRATGIHYTPRAVRVECDLPTLLNIASGGN